MNLSQIASLLSLPCQQDIPIQGFSIDSRQITPGEMFVAITGERFDGHDFIVEAANKGAVAILCSRRVEGLVLPQLQVADPLQSFTKIAIVHRKSLSCPVIALTGSNGKTTVKEMIAAILPKPSLATKGNLNNHIGVPLTVMQLNSSHRYAVFELGANHAGEIAHTVKIVQPQVALVNNIAPAHIEGFGSMDGIARAKGEIYQGLGINGCAVINDDDNYAHFWDEDLADKKVLRFSITKPADIYAQNIRFTSQGMGQFSLVLADHSLDIALKVPGEHNIRNALATASCCYALGISPENIALGLQSFSGVAGRMNYLSGKNNSIIIDDTYNANLRSVLTALTVLASRKGKKIFVFGDMGELGQWAVAHHQEVGRAARQLGIDKLLTIGNHSQAAYQAFEGIGNHYSTQEELALELLTQLDEDTTVLVKGSRSSAMEKIVHRLLK